jgi:hypothetical protein
VADELDRGQRASLRYDLSGGGTETVVLIHEVGGCIESAPPFGETTEKALYVSYAPLTPAGKVNRQALREREAGRAGKS